MGLLDSVLGAALGGGGQGGGGAQGALLNMVLGMLAKGSGGAGAAPAAGGGLAGLGQLAEQFQRGGLGDVLGSWVGTGSNLPVSPEQLGQVLGGDQISGMASKLGINPGDLLGQLSQMLPDVVDKLTPNGQMPQQSDLGNLGQLGSMLGGLLGKR